MSEDDWRWHLYDTVKGSDWLGDQNAIHYMCNDGDCDLTVYVDVCTVVQEIRSGADYTWNGKSRVGS